MPASIVDQQKTTNVLPPSLPCQTWLFPAQAGGTVHDATEPIQTMGLKISPGMGQSVFAIRLSPLLVSSDVIMYRVTTLHQHVAYASRLECCKG